MAGYMNRATLIGNLGQDPEIRVTTTGEKVAALTLATTESWIDKRSGEKQERTEWHRITVWTEGLIGVLEKYVTKGDKVMIEGMLKTRKWVDQAGNERYTTEIVLSGFNGQMILLGSPAKAQRNSAATPNQSAGRDKNNAARDKEMAAGGGTPLTGNDTDDKIPF